MPEQIRIARIAGSPQFDRLPVYKLCCDERTPPNDRVFAQAQLCQNEDTLFARIWSFESEPEPDVLLAAQFSREHCLAAATVSMGGEVSLVVNGESKPGVLTAHLFSGEDLQGEYKGAVLALPLSEIFSALAIDQSKDDTRTIDVNLLRVGPRQAAVSSLAPVGEPVPAVL